MKRELCHSVLCLVAVGLLGCAAAAPAAAAGLVGAPLPALKLPDTDGHLVALRSAPGTVTVINFWASWCGPCEEEIAALVHVNQRWRHRGVRLIGIAIDSGKPAEVAKFAYGHNIDYTVLVTDTGWVRQHFHLNGIPITLVVDGNGIVREYLTGPQTEAMLRHAVAPYRQALH
ncbi:MAG TPA: TlpA disulfide reductase family protein [Gammaproteobacteria bacterium]|jgi:thiol-disulfide isomerase/thioredoxin|nr:TlpA disulfide reductase family protein [Gammaproteobacteria bacterium]